jgi:hypothetical protein
VASRHWLKVARILVDAARVKGVEIPDTEKGLRVLARRIEALVRQGRLVAQGDLRKWRHSEVRLPQRSRRNQGRACTPLRAVLAPSQLTRQEALRRLQFFTNGIKIGCQRYGLDWAPERLATLSDFSKEASKRKPDWKRLNILRKGLSHVFRARKLVSKNDYILEYADIICEHESQ